MSIDTSADRARRAAADEAPVVTRTPGRPRLTFMINSLAGGGAERVMSSLLHHSRQECEAFDCSLVLLDKEPSVYAPPAWLTVHQLDGRGSLLRSFIQVLALFGRIRPDTTVSFLTRSNIINLIASRARGRPSVISERVNTTSHFGSTVSGRLGRAMVKLTYPQATRVIAVSAGVASDLARNWGVPARRIVTIENPVDTAMIRDWGARTPEITMEEPYVVAMGRLVPNKNFAMLIEAFALSGVPGGLVILGAGPERDNLDRVIDEHGLTDRVLIPGFVDNPFAVLRGATAYVSSSNAEGFPNALVEAMALGLPVISTNCASGPSEILHDSPREAIEGLTLAKFGVLTPPGSAPAMAEALVALQDDSLRRHYAQRSAERADQYDVSRAKARYWDVIRSTLDRQPAEATP